MNKINADSKVKAVVFDLDHTLFDRYETLKLVCHDLYTEKREWICKDVTENQLEKVMIDADAKYVIRGWHYMFEYWLEQGVVAKDENGELVAGEKDFFEFIWNYGFYRHAVKYPFTIPMLDELRAAGIKTGLITNAAGEKGLNRQKSKLRLLGIEDKFDSIMITASVGIHKPERGVFDITAQRLDLSPQNMMYVGDHPVNDVFASRRANYTPVWVRIREEVGEVCECEYSVKDVSEIPALVDKING